MKIKIANTTDKAFQKAVKITGSKSETNRLLLLQALYPSLNVANVSNADDAVVMQKGLTQTSGVVDIHHAGTAMRFLTSFFATKEGAEVSFDGFCENARTTYQNISRSPRTIGR